MKLLRNPARGSGGSRGTRTHDALAFHQRLPGYRPTPLVDAAGLARELGLARVWVKDESARLDLPSFKILGASWAIYRALADRFGIRFEGSDTFDDLAVRARAAGRLTLAAATDGNHGRAVARIARLLGFAARIYVPAGTAQARIDAIADEGASVEVVDGSYGDAVERSAQDEGDSCIVVSDTSWPGYERIPRWVIDGYSTILLEVENELAERGDPGPTLVVVQMGVGALAAAVASHFKSGRDEPVILGVEPADAACILASVRAGDIVAVPGPHRSIMAGLNCDAPSVVAWPIVSSGVDWFLAVEDERAREAMRMLARHGVVSGETGAAGLAGLLAVLDDESAAREIGLDAEARVLLFSTEGATDAAAYREIVGNDPDRSEEP